MSVYIDTSAFYALLDANDQNHSNAGSCWINMLQNAEHLVTCNYVVVETSTLIRSRSGLKLMRRFHEEAVPLLSVVWVDEHLHDEGVLTVLAANKRNLSVVDCVSFAVMRRLGIKRVFTFDSHFKEQGFECIP